MRNIFIKTTLFFVAIVLMMACSDDYLTQEPSQFLSAEQIAEATALNPDIQAANVAGIYSNMYKTGTGGTSNHDDFGQKGYDIYTDMLCSDMVLGGTNYGWYKSLSEYTATVDYTRNENYKPWRYYYRIIQGANSVIDALGGTDAVPETDDGKHYMGQAKAMRAYAYFYLANLYAKSYNPDELILPIYKDTKVPNQPKSKTSDVYALIIDDLDKAIEYLDDFNRSAKNEVNKYVAEGLQAYAYGAMGNYQKVLDLTKDIIDNGGYVIVDTTKALGGFNDVSTPGWIWGVDLTKDNDLDLVSWWGQVDMYTYSYAWAGDPKVIDKTLYDNIKPTDVRKKQFKGSKLYPIGKFYHPEKKIGGQRTITCDYVYMRVAEMYLLKAEAEANISGKENDAKNTLKVLLSNRFKNAADYAYVDALTGQDLKNEIYLQTRIELWGEGKSYLAMKRNKATITRGPNHLSFAGTSYSYDDPKLSFVIPQSEIQNNPMIND